MFCHISIVSWTSVTVELWRATHFAGNEQEDIVRKSSIVNILNESTTYFTEAASHKHLQTKQIDDSAHITQSLLLTGIQ
jgi:hypothetical protein